MINPLSHVGQTARPETSSQAQQQQQQQDGQAQSQDNGQPATAPVPAEPPATRLPQHPQEQQGDHAPPSSEQQLREQQQRETDNEDAELRHDSAV